MELQNLQVMGYTFSVLVAGFELPTTLRDKLCINEDTWIDVLGEYSIQWDDDIPLVYIDSCTAISDYATAECNSYVQDYLRDLIQAEELKTWSIDRTEGEVSNIFRLNNEF